MRFTVTDNVDQFIAESTDPRLRGIVWAWSPGSAYIDYGLGFMDPETGETDVHAVDVLNVWDYDNGRCDLAEDQDSMREFLEDTYEDDDMVTAARQAIAFG